MFSFVGNLKLFIMEAKELRIGNYVYDPINKENVKLVAIEQGNRPITLGSKGTSSFSGFDCLQPIPLTEEILLKCGLKRSLYDRSYELNDFSIFLDKRIRENIYIQCEKRNWNVLNGIRIDYLHQLQNLYFALTNEELTVNL